MTLWPILAVLITFGLVIFLHEFGHFLVCVYLGIRVERFSFGFGPELLGMTRGQTRYSICAVPLGGYVKPAGESLEDTTGQPDEYFSRPPQQRLLIVFAGPAMNYVLAFFLFFGVIYFRGMPEPSTEPVIGDMAMDYPAKKAGLMPHDRVLKVNGVEVSSWQDMASFIHRNPGKVVDVSYLRDGKPGSAKVTPQLDKDTGRGLIGIMPEVRYANIGVFRAAKEGAGQCWYWTRYTIETLAEKIYKREKPDLAGPVGIVQMVTKAARSGLEDLVFLIGLISVAIGFFNLLPVPLLDGGHAVLYLYEWLSRRKLTVKLMATANSVGLVLLVSLLIFATYNDVVRIREGRKPKAEREGIAVHPPAQGLVSPSTGTHGIALTTPVSAN